MKGKEGPIVFNGVGIDGLAQVAQAMLASSEGVRVWLFEGEMGSGKTALIKAICRELGVEDNMSSPTFPIVHEYGGRRGEPIYHFDFYRINNETEAREIGSEEYFYSGNYCFIEWPEKIPSLLPSRTVSVKLALENQQQRTILFTLHDGKEKIGV